MYDRKKAVEYAYKWWNKRNPSFFNYDYYGGDCTNFISQCLLAGGINMDSSSKMGWYYNNSYDRSYSWTGVNEFFKFSVNNSGMFGPKVKKVTVKEVEVGDIVQLVQYGEVFHHNLLITKIVGENVYENILLTCHTFDVKDKKLSDYVIKDIRFLKVLN